VRDAHQPPDRKVADEDADADDRAVEAVVRDHQLREQTQNRTYMG
jgi:hypothetical protein